MKRWTTGTNADSVALPFLDQATRKRSIRQILLMILAVSLVPLALLAAWQVSARMAHETAEQNAALNSAARMTAASERNLMHGARALLTLLASNKEVIAGDPAACGRVLAAASNAYPAYANMSFLGPDGTVRCSSLPAAVGMPLQNPALFADVRDKGFAVSAPFWGFITNRQVLAALMPVRNADGEFLGVLTASIDLGWVKRLLADLHIGDKAAVMIVDQTGAIIASSRPVEWSSMRLPEHPGALGRGHTAAGNSWTYAAAPLHRANGAGNSYSVVYAKPDPPRFGPDWWFLASYFALPVLALLLASLAIWIGANRAILRWVGRLSLVAEDIGQGRASAELLRFRNAPSELRQLAGSLAEMGDTIKQRDLHLQEALDRQRAIALELNHRVRNNLQVISSFLGLEARSLPPGAERQALERAQLRVAALGLVHRHLLDGGELVTVSTSSLFGQICKLLGEQPAIREATEIHCDLEDHEISIDAAIPMGLWLVEIVEHISRRGARGARGCIAISLRAVNDTVRLEADGSGLGPARLEPVQPRLAPGIARQLGGKMETLEDGPADLSVSLSIAAQRLALPLVPGVAPAPGSARADARLQ